MAITSKPGSIRRYVQILLDHRFIYDSSKNRYFLMPILGDDDRGMRELENAIVELIYKEVGKEEPEDEKSTWSAS